MRADKLFIARKKNILSTEKNIFLRAENIITARSYFFVFRRENSGMRIGAKKCSWKRIKMQLEKN